MRTKSLLVATCMAALSSAAFAQGPMMNMANMGETMKRMQEQMKQIQAASDPKERQRLIEEHLKSMQETMPMMAGMKDMGQGCMGMMQPQK